MKKKNFNFLILIILFSGQLFSQNIEKIWFSSYSMEIQKSSYDSDTIYDSAFGILDFIDSANVVLKTYKRSLENFKYSLINNDLKIKKDTIELNGTLISNQISLNYNIDDFTIKKIFFDKLKPSQLSLSKIPDSTYFYNSNWTIKSDSTNSNFELNLDFLENNEVLITKDHGENGYTNVGIYSTDIYKNNFFINILDRVNLVENIYHFYNFSNSEFNADSYILNKGFGTKPPIYKKLKFIKQPNLDNEKLNQIKSRLVGKWKAINNPIPHSDFSKYDSLKNQSFEISLLVNNTFKIRESGVLIKNKIETPKELIFSGNWKLSKTGKYIKLISNIKLPDSFITIKELSENSLQIYFEIRELDINNFKLQKIELKK